jgi:sugar O-acyltransferase (sialic acid O-acetyltransferase NeuD family)
MKKFQILGHDNNSLSMLVDTLYALYGEQVCVEVVSIIPLQSFRGHVVPFRIKGMDITELTHEQWTRKDDHELLPGTLVAKIKQKISAFFAEKHNIAPRDYANLIHPSAVLPKVLEMGTGVTVGPGSVIAPYSKLGTFVSVNRNVGVGHHVIVKAFATLNPGVNIAGFCQIGKGVTVGMGANILDGVQIGDYSTIGAGSVVTKNIPPGVVAYGVPAKVIREKKDT